MTDHDVGILILENAPEKATTVYIRKGIPREDDLEIGQGHSKPETRCCSTSPRTIWIAEADNFLTSCNGNFELDSRV